VYHSEVNALKAAVPYGLTLDVGVGSGAFASKLNASVGIDISGELLKISKRRGLEVINADANSLPLRKEAFDTVISSFTICFIDDVGSMLTEVKRVLKTRGKLILGEVTLDSQWGRLYSQEGRRRHRFYGKARFLTFRETKSLLTKAGFRIERIFGTIDFLPRDKPRFQSPVKLANRDSGHTDRYGFICIVARSANRLGHANGIRNSKGLHRKWQ
jgi:ubiquinone/menaquinone biosynthesis C-methylase UbiE